MPSFKSHSWCIELTSLSSSVVPCHFKKNRYLNAPSVCTPVQSAPTMPAAAGPYFIEFLCINICKQCLKQQMWCLLRKWAFLNIWYFLHILFGIVNDNLILFTSNKLQGLTGALVVSTENMSELLYFSLSQQTMSLAFYEHLMPSVIPYSRIGETNDVMLSSTSEANAGFPSMSWSSHQVVLSPCSLSQPCPG